MDNVIEIKSCWTCDMGPKMKADFMFVVNSVFGQYCSEEYFGLKYSENPYGESVIVVAYENGAPVGADALWRNDVMGCKSYQSADTAVIESSRGKGIFTKMVKEKLSKINDDSLIYGFPNRNSFHGFEKMGWTVGRLYKSLFFCKSFLKESDEIIDNVYANWWLKPQKGLSYIRKGKYYFLIRKKKGKPICHVIGRVDREVALMYPKTQGPFILTYFSNKPSLLKMNDVGMPYILYTRCDVEIPYWKIDSI